MIQFLRALDALLKDPGLIPSTYMAAHKSLPPIPGHQACRQFTDIYAGKTRIYTK